jgi:hypothetical protein
MEGSGGGSPPRSVPPTPLGPGDLRIEGVAVSAQTPCVTSAGTLYIPMGAVIRAFDRTGAELDSIETSDLGISARTFDAGYDPRTNTLLFGDKNGRSSMLVALDATTKSVKWAATGACNQCAVLPRQGMVVAISSVADKLHVQRLEDGTPVASVPLRCPSNLTAEARSSFVYACTWNPPRDTYAVAAFQWRQGWLVPLGKLEAVPETRETHPLAVVPAPPGKYTPYLVVGALRKSTLLVLSLPEHALVHTHELPPGTEVQGLAAAPDGSLLVVMDRASKAALLLAWPLAGMPPDTRAPPSSLSCRGGGDEGGGGCCSVQ